MVERSHHGRTAFEAATSGPLHRQSGGHSMGSIDLTRRIRTVALFGLLASVTSAAEVPPVDLASVCAPVRANRPRNRLLARSAGDPPRLVSGDGWVRFPALGRPRGVALWSYAAPAAEVRFPEYALYLSAAERIFVREGDGTEADVGAYTPGDEIQIGVRAGTVEYSVNGQVLHVSAKRPAYPLEALECFGDPVPVLTPEQVRLEGWSFSPGWSLSTSWVAQDPDVPAVASSPLPRPRSPAEWSARQAAVADYTPSPRAAEFLEFADHVRKYGASDEEREKVMAALEDADADVQAGAVWALQALAAGGSSDAAAAIEAESPPRLLKRGGKANYPVAAFVKRMEGVVGLEVLVSREGRVLRAEVRESMPGFDEAAVGWARGWTFEPARRQGKPFPSVVREKAIYRLF
jgi:TonB family protein